MENAMKPTVGRVVYYKSYGTPGGEYPSVDRAAVITEVLPPSEGEEVDRVSLCVMNPTGLFFNQNVKHGSEGGQWNWMPYQLKVARDNQEKAEII